MSRSTGTVCTGSWPRAWERVLGGAETAVLQQHSILPHAPHAARTRERLHKMGFHLVDNCAQLRNVTQKAAHWRKDGGRKSLLNVGIYTTVCRATHAGRLELFYHHGYQYLQGRHPARIIYSTKRKQEDVHLEDCHS